MQHFSYFQYSFIPDLYYIFTSRLVSCYLSQLHSFLLYSKLQFFLFFFFLHRFIIMFLFASVGLLNSNTYYTHKHSDRTTVTSLYLKMKGEVFFLPSYGVTSTYLYLLILNWNFELFS